MKLYYSVLVENNGIINSVSIYCVCIGIRENINFMVDSCVLVIPHVTQQILKPSHVFRIKLRITMWEQIRQHIYVHRYIYICIWALLLLEHRLASNFISSSIGNKGLEPLHERFSSFSTAMDERDAKTNNAGHLNCSK